MSSYILFPFICTIVGGFFILVAGTIVLVRYLNYRENMALAEKGLMPPEKLRNGKDTLRWGIIITALGLALCIGLLPLGRMVGMNYPLGFGPWMLLGLLPLFFGLALILIHLLTGKSEKDVQGRPPSGSSQVDLGYHSSENMIKPEE